MNKIVKGLMIAGILGASLMAFTRTADAKDKDGNIVIVIDPGHGGEDPGSLATTGATESKCNYAIAEVMKKELSKYDGVKVYLTREEDTWMTNMGRAMIAADLNADFLISIHNNSGSDSNTGALAFRSLNSYYAEATNDMCTYILDNLEKTGLKNGGVQTRVSTTYDFEDYYTLIGEGVRAGVPSIIVEHCFLSNPDDAKFISNSDGTLNTENIEKMGKADADAVVTYFKLSEKTAVADNNTEIVLEKGYSVKVSPEESGDVSWYSTSQNVATVDETGYVTAVGEGTTSIVYKTAAGKEGKCTVTVNQPKSISLTGGIDPTFYTTDDEMNKFDKKAVFAYVIYSDGTARKVTPDSVGTVDLAKVGIQDIDIKYGELTGKLRICHNTDSYIHSVTEKASEQETPSESVSSTDNDKPSESVTDGAKETTDNKSFIKEFGLYIIIVAALVVVGIIIMFIEKKKRRRRRNRSRKYL